MPVLVTLLRSTLRTSARGLLLLGLIIGVAGGAVLTGAAAARRTDSAFDRLVDHTAGWDLLVNPDAGIDSELDMAEVARLPGVAMAARAEGVALGPATVEDVADLETGPIALASDGVVGYEFARPLVEEGRLPDPDAADEAFLSGPVASDLGLGVGDRLAGRLLRFEDFAALEEAGGPEGAVARYNDPATGELVDLTIVGTGVAFDEIVVDEGFGGGSVSLTPAFFEAHGEPSAGYWGGLVRLEPGADIDRLRADIEALVPGEAIAFQGRRGVEEQFDRAVDPQVTALTVFTALAGLIALVVVGQAVSRRLQADAVALEPLGALGVTSGQRLLLGVARIAVAAVGGAAVAVIVAVAASPVAPVGVARRAEPDPGVRLDLPVLVVGAVAVTATFIALAAWSAGRAGRRPALTGDRRTVGSRVATLGVAPATATGVRFAFDRVRSGVPVRATLVGAATSVALVVATVVFSTNLNHFVERPELYGTPWNAVLDVEAGAETPTIDQYAPVLDALAEREDVDRFGLLHPGQVELDGVSLPAVAIDPSERPIVPSVLEGRIPRGAAEVALGARTAADLGVDVGDDVTVARGDRSARLTVVGEVVLPAVGSYSGADKTTLGSGVLADREVLAAWGPRFSPYGIVAALTDGVTAADVAADLVVPAPEFVVPLDVSVPSDVQSLERVRSTPLTLTGLLAALLALTVVHALAVAVRARRREVAVLRTLGFTRWQVLGTVAVQAGLIATLGLVIGIPVGAVVGRVAWSAVADHLGAVVELVTPSAAIGWTSLAVLTLALAVGVVPGLRATATCPAETLRTE